eukprot:10909006-Ditylum_brightwellii.AAC.1
MKSGLCKIQSAIGRQKIAAFTNIARNSISTAAFATSARKLPPKQIIDTQQSCFSPSKNQVNASSLALEVNAYLPDNRKAGILDPLAKIGVEVDGTVHARMTNDCLAEANRIQSLIDSGHGNHTEAIIAPCNLAAPDVEEKICALKASSPRVKGVRWIFEHEEGTAPLQACEATRPLIHYLYGDHYDHFQRIEKGMRTLKKHGLSLDLVCAPSQLPLAAKLLKWHS